MRIARPCSLLSRRRARPTGHMRRSPFWPRAPRTRASGNFDGVHFVFVDRDVTISRVQVVDNWDDNGFTETFTTRAFNIALQEGWNAVRVRGSETWGPTGGSGTSTISLGNPNVRWVLWDDDSFALSGDLESLDEAPARQGRGQLPPSRLRR